MQRQTSKNFVLGLLTVCILTLTGCGKGKETAPAEQAAAPEAQTTAPAETSMPAAQSLPDTVSFNKEALYPEGLEYDASSNRFMVTSLF